VLKAENEQVVEAFLESTRIQPWRACRARPEPLRQHISQGMLRIDPARDHLDGFFIARFERTR
jgi:16S rRNA C967 or C1407 C5-methylase (RsmB/RsmF family)